MSTSQAKNFSTWINN